MILSHPPYQQANLNKTDNYIGVYNYDLIFEKVNDPKMLKNKKLICDLEFLGIKCSQKWPAA